jgi:hypothetical protein
VETIAATALRVQRRFAINLSQGRQALIAREHRFGLELNFAAVERNRTVATHEKKWDLGSRSNSTLARRVPRLRQPRSSRARCITTVTRRHQR